MTCGTVFTSLESVDLSGSFSVTDNKVLEPFQRDKLFLSIFDSLKHRKTALSDATALTDTILSRLIPLMTDATVEKTRIIELSLACLKHFDRAAATHYEAFHSAA